jgi:hypothetical protein
MSRHRVDLKEVEQSPDGRYLRVSPTHTDAAVRFVAVCTGAGTQTGRCTHDTERQAERMRTVPDARDTCAEGNGSACLVLLAPRVPFLFASPREERQCATARVQRQCDGQRPHMNKRRRVAHPCCDVCRSPVTPVVSLTRSSATAPTKRCIWRMTPKRARKSHGTCSDIRLQAKHCTAQIVSERLPSRSVHCRSVHCLGL